MMDHLVEKYLDFINPSSGWSTPKFLQIVCVFCIGVKPVAYCGVEHGMVWQRVGGGAMVMRVDPDTAAGVVARA